MTLTITIFKKKKKKKNDRDAQIGLNIFGPMNKSVKKRKIVYRVSGGRTSIKKGTDDRSKSARNRISYQIAK